VRHPRSTRFRRTGLPTYRFPTGIDDDAFYRRVSEALERGYLLYGGPALSDTALIL
jgi:hypothetical protein